MKWLCHSEGWRVTEAALFINLGPTSAFHLISLRQESWLTSLLIIVRFGLRWKGAMNFPSVLQEEWNLHFPGICDFHNLNFFLKKKKKMFSLLVGQTLIPVPLSLCLYRVSVESAQCYVGFYAWNCQVGTVTTVHITHTLTHTGAGPF